MIIINYISKIRIRYVPAADLHEWAARAAVEIGWNTGLMDWQYSSD
jgi:hypothetical protein